MTKIEYADEPKAQHVEPSEDPAFLRGRLLGFIAENQLLTIERNELKAQLAALQPQTLLSDGMIECAICQQDISIGCSYRNSDAGTVHDMESDCAANLGFVFDALEKAEAQIATARQGAFAEFREITEQQRERETDNFAIDTLDCLLDSMEAHAYADENDSAPIPKPPVQLSTEAAQGCECENCRDERRLT